MKLICIRISFDRCIVPFLYFFLFALQLRLLAIYAAKQDSEMSALKNIKPTATTTALSHSLEEQQFLIDDFPEQPPSCYIPRRHCIMLMLFLGLVMAYGLRVCISIAAAPVSNASSGPAVSIYNEFGWTDTEKGIVLSAFFYG